MSKSAERKRGGVYYTPAEFTAFIVENTVGKLADEKIDLLERNLGVRLSEIDAKTEKKRVIAFAQNAIEELREIKIVDPACGCGHFLSVLTIVLKKNTVICRNTRNSRPKTCRRTWRKDFLFYPSG